MKNKRIKKINDNDKFILEPLSAFFSFTNIQRRTYYDYRNTRPILKDILMNGWIKKCKNIELFGKELTDEELEKELLVSEAFIKEWREKRPNAISLVELALDDNPHKRIMPNYWKPFYDEVFYRFVRTNLRMTKDKRHKFEVFEIKDSKEVNKKDIYLSLDDIQELKKEDKVRFICLDRLDS